MKKIILFTLLLFTSTLFALDVDKYDFDNMYFIHTSNEVAIMRTGNLCLYNATICEICPVSDVVVKVVYYYNNKMFTAYIEKYEDITITENKTSQDYILFGFGYNYLLLVPKKE